MRAIAGRRLGRRLTFDVRVRSASATGAFGATARWMSAVSETAASYSGQMGSTYCFSARAIGADLQVGPWGAESCTSVPLDDDALGAAGAWSHRTDAAYGGDYSQAGKRGATLTKSNLKAATWRSSSPPARAAAP